MIWPERVVGRLVAETDDDLGDLEEWLDEIEFGEEPLNLSTADLDACWDRLVGYSRDELYPSFEEELRLMMGELAELLDVDASTDVDQAALISVVFREHLEKLGRAPSGLWKAELLADRASNALGEFEMWRSLDPVPAAAKVLQELTSLLDECDELIAQSRSIPTRRHTSATSAICSARVEDPDQVIARVDRFFDLEQRARRESGNSPSLDELMYVAVAGVTAYGAKADAAGIQELMRRIRLLAEPAGESLPVPLLHVWSQALTNVDPAFSQMLALQMLQDTWIEGTTPTDSAFEAAFALFEATVSLDDAEGVEALVVKWVPMALEAPPGDGASAWLDLIDEVETE
ncbi:MAG: hypothetical protein Q7V57_03065 [Actinomycetota bacterium]|nr:hypothetical protein [Actinomycetota bacterium]